MDTEKKAKLHNAIRLGLLAAGIGVAVGAVFVAARWWPASYAAAAAPAAAAESECVFVNHVRVGPGHPYRQENGEKCRYVIVPVTTY
jgi:hypothetical protein